MAANDTEKLWGTVEENNSAQIKTKRTRKHQRKSEDELLIGGNNWKQPQATAIAQQQQ